MGIEPDKNFWGARGRGKPTTSGTDNPYVVRPLTGAAPEAPSKSGVSSAAPTPVWASAGSGTKTAAASAPATTPKQENRRFPRFKCEGNLELKTEGSTIRTWATFTDISVTGCYVEMMTTFPVGTKLDMQLGMNGFIVNAEAIVRVTYPFLGMGIEFKEMLQHDRKQLGSMLASLSASSLTRANASTKKTVTLPSIAEPGAVIDALVRFFETKATLSPEEFVRLVETSQRRGM
jgi:hypothetical protein